MNNNAQEMVIISPDGFIPDGWKDFPPETRLTLENDTGVESLKNRLSGIRGIEIIFPGVHDGRGFSLARRLRDLGYRGELRARGALHADQMRHALLSGFDTIAISPERAARIPEKYWVEQAKNMLPAYQNRFMGDR